MSRLLLIRHAPTAETGLRLTGRLPGVSLGEAGTEAARRVAERLSALRLAAVYSSPIERTWETAVEVARPHRLEPLSHDGLLEVDFGSWSGRTLRSLARLKAWRTVQLSPSRVTYPGGEAVTHAQARAVAACEDIAHRHRRSTVGVVTHADVIRLALAHYLGQPLDLFQRLGVAPASVSVVDLPAEGPPRVAAINTNGDPSTWR